MIVLRSALAYFLKFTTCTLKIIKSWRMSMVATVFGINLYQGLSTASYGDVITLKNGKRISVERSWEEGNKLRYEKHGNVYGFSKDLVEKVETGTYLPDPDEPKGATRKPVSKSIPIEIVHQNLDIGNPDSINWKAQVIKDGKVDNEQLAEIG